jgi:hypothetical protein
MKKQSNILSASFNSDDLVNRTINSNQTGFVSTCQNHKNFTAADLWNIQNHAKARLQRRYL